MTIADTLEKKFVIKDQLLVGLIVVTLGVLIMSLQSLSDQVEHPLPVPNLFMGVVTGLILCFGSRYVIGVIVGSSIVIGVTSFVLPFTPSSMVFLSGSLAPLIALYALRERLVRFATVSSVTELIRATGFIFVPLSLLTPLLFLLTSVLGNNSFTLTLSQFFADWFAQLNGCILVIPIMMEWRFAQAQLLKSRHLAISLLLSVVVLLLGQIVFFDWFSLAIVRPYWLIYASVSFVLMTQSARIVLLIPLLISLQIVISVVLKKGFFANDFAQTGFLNANIFMFGYTMAVLCALYFLIDAQILKLRLEDKLAALRLKSAALDAISQGVVITDCDKKITYVNQGFRDLTLYDDAQLIGRNCNLLQGDDSNPTTINQIRLALDARKTVHVEILNYKSSGEQFWNEVHISPVLTNGVLTQFVGVQQDITWRKQAETDARLAKIVFEHNRNAITITDSATKIIAVNPTFTIITGYSAQEAIGNTPHMLSAGLHDDNFYQEMWRNLSQYGFWEGEVVNKRANGEIYPQYLTISRVLDSRHQVTNYIGMFRDVTIEKSIDKKILDLQENDQLTGLKNLPSLIKVVTTYIDVCNEQEHYAPTKTAALFLIDIDHFQNINDTLGHHVGDVVLVKIAQLLKNLSNPSYSLARQGGDEFAFFLPDVSKEDAKHFAKHLLQQLMLPFEADGHRISVTASIGVANYPEDGTNMHALLTSADVALNHIKNNGRAKYQLHTSELTQALKDKISIEIALETAAQKEEFQLFYQPVVDIVSGSICGFEALIRWRHPTLGLISPDKFIPIAEQSNSIAAIGRWVLHRACRDIRSALDEGISMPPVAINLSAKQFTKLSLVDDLTLTLAEYQLESNNLSIEITEGVLMENPIASKNTLDKLRDLGFSLALDDFGTGYSSLSYLKNFSFDKVKIDQSFVRELLANSSDAAIVKAIINMGHSLGIRVLAEGVETEEQCAFLRDHVVDEIQGYYFSRPLEKEQMRQLLKDDRRLAPHLVRLPPISKTLLLVDDEQNIVSALKRLLRRDGYEILTANSGADGLAVLAANKVDVIISDQRMPGMTGVEFLSLVKEKYPNTIRLVLSGYTELKSVTDAINEGSVFRFLTKPWDDDKLRECVSEAFQYKNYADENRKLSLQAQNSNFELAIANRQLSETIEKKQHQITVHTHSLDIVREALRYTPVAVLGLDDQYMVAFINEAAIELFKELPLNFGDELLFCLPELGEMIMHTNESSSNLFLFDRQKFIVRWFNMGTSSTKGKIITLSLVENVPEALSHTQLSASS
jgi:diguanylate cyclase (GGDEF)-like protein/PAS domain S-box-containing protein